MSSGILTIPKEKGLNVSSRSSRYPVVGLGHRGALQIPDVLPQAQELPVLAHTRATFAPPRQVVERGQPTAAGDPRAPLSIIALPWLDKSS